MLSKQCAACSPKLVGCRSGLPAAAACVPQPCVPHADTMPGRARQGCAWAWKTYTRPQAGGGPPRPPPFGPRPCQLKAGAAPAIRSPRRPAATHVSMATMEPASNDGKHLRRLVRGPALVEGERLETSTHAPPPLDRPLFWLRGIPNRGPRVRIWTTGPGHSTGEKREVKVRAIGRFAESATPTFLTVHVQANFFVGGVGLGAVGAG